MDVFERAGRHPITVDKPAVNFFEGALLGNGGLGVVVTTRPDGVLLHFGHNSVWDIRVAENHADEFGTFAEVLEKVKAIPADLSALEDDAWYREYLKLTRENYRAPYPRPFPCGSLLLGFDRRRAELLGHHLDISCGVCTVQIRVRDSGEDIRLEIFTEMDHDRVWLRTVDRDGRAVRSPFERVRLLPDPDTPKDFPRYEVNGAAGAGTFGFTQILPATEPDRYDAENGDPRDQALRLALAVHAAVSTWQPQASRGAPRPVDLLERATPDGEELVCCVQLDHGPASAVRELPLVLPGVEEREPAGLHARTLWEAYWSRSGVALGDELLERVWYWNLYLFNCAVSPDATCPGLFANWSFRSIGTAWHGDYHMNYNTQQPFWLAFSSNHVDKHLAYANLVDHVLPISRSWARDYYGLRGAYFPHSAYPTEMNIMPYPVPHWGWEVCETPWTVQSLWWHYRYTMDTDFLRSRAFGPIKEAVRFLTDYMMRPDARWDGRYHIFPTVVPELYGLTPGLTKNHDCLVDLTLTRFVFTAFLDAVAVLGYEAQEAELVGEVREVLGSFPDYPTGETENGTVFVSVPGEDPEVVYNTPNSVMTVFPGEHHGLHSSPEDYEVAANSFRRHRNEGGNELVFLNLQGARLGLLDLERFKRQIRYCLLPNGVCQDMVLQVHGRYQDLTPYDFMRHMGIWFENLALPVVINECLLQSYTGTLRLFPNWPLTKAAEFESLRAVGGFLVSAACADGRVQWIRIVSEAGETLSIHSPWKPGEIITRETRPGEVITLTA